MEKKISHLVYFVFQIKCLSKLRANPELFQEGVSEGECWRSAHIYWTLHSWNQRPGLQLFPEFASGPDRPARSSAAPRGVLEPRAWQVACLLTPLPLLAFPEMPAHATATLPLRSHAPASELLGSCREGRQWRVDVRTGKGLRVEPGDSP